MAKFKESDMLREKKSGKLFEVTRVCNGFYHTSEVDEGGNWLSEDRDIKFCDEARYEKRILKPLAKAELKKILEAAKTAPKDKNGTKYKVWHYAAGPASSPYLCTCNSLERAQAAIVKATSAKIVKLTDVDFISYSGRNVPKRVRRTSWYIEAV